MGSVPVGSVTTVPVKSAVTSKINWTQLIGVASMLGTAFGLKVTPEQQAAIITTIGVAQGVITFVMRTWFTKSVISSST